MASLFFLFCLGMGMPSCLAVQERSPSLPFLQRRTGDVIHHGGGGTSCVVKGSYCQVKFLFHWHVVRVSHRLVQNKVQSQIPAKKYFLTPCALSTLCKIIMLILYCCEEQTRTVQPRNVSFRPISPLSTLWIPASCTNGKFSSPGYKQQHKASLLIIFKTIF